MGLEEKHDLNAFFAASRGLGHRPLVLATKLHNPRVPSNLVRRPRLLSSLNAALQHPLTLVSAPAGSGKTTLLAEWAATDPCPLAWVSLDATENDPLHFWTYFVSALQTIEKGIGETALLFLQSSGASQSEAVLIALLNELSGISQNGVLVLDDYHVITSQDIHRAMGYLIEHLPGCVHLVIASRSSPPLPLARLSVRDQLVELRQQDLNFTTPEIGEFLEQMHIPAMSPESIATLRAKTEGWPAGLRLVALSVQGRPDVSSYIAHLRGSQHRVARYLTEEVLSQLPPRTQEFLLKTSILDRLCAPLCDAVLCDAQLPSQGLLEHLESANLFLVPLDEERVWYRYHHLFADLLRSRLQETYPQHVPELYRRASLWYEQRDLTAQAIQTALAGQDWTRAERLLEDCSEEMMERSEVRTLLDWIQALPPEHVSSRPRLLLAKTWALIEMPGCQSEARVCLEAAERAVQANNDLSPDSVESKALLGVLLSLKCQEALIKGDYETARDYAQAALSIVPVGNSLGRHMAQTGLLFLSVSLGDLPAAHHHLDEVLRYQEATPSVLLNVYALYNRADLEILEGKLRDAAESLRQCLACTTVGERTYLPIATYPLCRIAGLCYELNDLAAAQRYLTLSLELSASRSLQKTVIEAYALAARIHQSLNNLDDTLASLRRVERAFERRYLGLALAHLSASHLRAWLFAGRLQGLKPAIPALGSTLNTDGDIPPARQDDALAAARWAVAKDDWDSALSWLGPLVRSAEHGKFQRRLIEALILEALAFWGSGNRRQAHFALARSLELAEREGYVRVFVDEGAPMRAMLEQAADRGVTPNYARRLLTQFGEIPLDGVVPLIDGQEPLSERELAVLRLVASGRSTHEIASQLVVSTETVRSHLAHIYAKLHVHSRLQAVRQARDLDLL